MNIDRLEYLFNLYLNDSCTDMEREELFLLLKEQGAMDHIRASAPEFELDIKDMHRLDAATSSQILDAILKVQPADSSLRTKTPAGKVRIFNPLRYAVAAAAIILVSVGTYFWINASNPDAANGPIASPGPVPADIKPGKDRAILTLADGRQLDLDSATNGNLAVQGNIKIVKKDGVVTYIFEEAENADQLPIAYNTLTTPRGGQHRLELPDGTKVWLNSASSIRFPTKFNKEKRSVEASGELYFEVVSKEMENGADGTSTASEKLPFVVSIAGTQVEVLGTHFNINAYPQEGDVKTTLLEGSVRVKSANDQVLLSPGQQSRKAEDGALSVEKNVNTAQVIAWKNGEFNFQDTDIKTIMNRLSIWYDIDVQYKGKVPSKRFTSNISMNTNLSQMLEILRASGLGFSLEGRILTVHS